MERKMAHIEKILAIEPVTNSDGLDKATVLGWTVVVKRDQFKVGDLVVYMEVDSILPERPEFEFLRSKHFRIKTCRLRGQVSQGICFPLDILPQDFVFVEGQDVTDVLGVTKYEPYVPADLRGTIKGNFPSWLVKTDETRIQAVPEVLQRWKGEVFAVTEKLDGCSITIYLKDGQFGVCSRNMELCETEGNTFWKTVRSLGIEEKLRALGKNICLQGEMVGPGIQKNKYKFSDINIFFFNVFLIDEYRFMDFMEARDTLKSLLGLTAVPYLGYIVLIYSVEELVGLSKGSSAFKECSQREGIVIRPLFENRDPDLGRLSFKVINPDFLLKHDE